MKFMLLIYNNPAALEAMPQEAKDKIFADVDAIMKDLTERGELIGGTALADVARTKTVRIRDGELTTTDGPFLEAKEHFAGYIAVDVDSVERAVEIARCWPDARDGFGAMEVRPFMDNAGLEM